MTNRGGRPVDQGQRLDRRAAPHRGEEGPGPGHALQHQCRPDRAGQAQLQHPADRGRLPQDRPGSRERDHQHELELQRIDGTASATRTGWGSRCPIRGSITSTRAVPKFRTNSDLILDRATDRDISMNRTEDLSVSLAKRPGQSWWGRYLVEPFSANASYRTAVNLQPTQRDTTVNRSAGVSWSLPLEQWLGQKLDLSLEPERTDQAPLHPHVRLGEPDRRRRPRDPIQPHGPLPSLREAARARPRAAGR